MLPIISVNSKQPGLLLVNGIMAGDIAEDRWVNIPVNPIGACYLHYLSATPQYNQLGIRIDLAEGRLTDAGHADCADVIQWPENIYEITLKPWESARNTSVIVPETLEKLEYDAGEVSLLRYSGLWLVGEDRQGRIIMSEPLPQESISASLVRESVGFSVYGDTVGGGKWCAGYRDKQDFYACGDNVERAPGHYSVSVGLCDMAQHTAVREFRLSGLWNEERRIRTQNRSFAGADEVACAFLQAMALGEYEEARGYLTEALRKQLTPIALKSFIGEMTTCCSARYARPPSTGESVYALIRPAENGIMKAECLYFTTKSEGGGAYIDDIRP